MKIVNVVSTNAHPHLVLNLSHVNLKPNFHHFKIRCVKSSWVCFSTRIWHNEFLTHETFLTRKLLRIRYLYIDTSLFHNVHEEYTLTHSIAKPQQWDEHVIYQLQPSNNTCMNSTHWNPCNKGSHGHSFEPLERWLNHDANSAEFICTPTPPLYS